MSDSENRVSRFPTVKLRVQPKGKSSPGRKTDPTYYVSHKVLFHTTWAELLGLDSEENAAPTRIVSDGRTWQLAGE